MEAEFQPKVIDSQGQFYAITFWPKIKIEKNVKIYQNTLSRDYLCKKIVKGGW